MSIFILEDKKLQGRVMKNIILEFLDTHYMGVENVELFNCGRILLERVKMSVSSNLYFVNIKLGNKVFAGFDIAKEIRELDSRGIIVFVTSHSKFILKSCSYMISALTFIEETTDLKIFISRIHKCVSHYYEKKIEIKTMNS